MKKTIYNFVRSGTPSREYGSYLLSATDIVDDTSSRGRAESGSRSELSKLSCDSRIRDSGGIMPKSDSAHSSSTSQVRQMLTL
jgi:hypothetical protein